MKVVCEISEAEVKNEMISRGEFLYGGSCASADVYNSPSELRIEDIDFVPSETELYYLRLYSIRDGIGDGELVSTNHMVCRWIGSVPAGHRPNLLVFGLMAIHPHHL